MILRVQKGPWLEIFWSTLLGEWGSRTTISGLVSNQSNSYTTYRGLSPDFRLVRTSWSTLSSLFESFIVISTRPSSPSTEFATTFPSPEESEPLVSTISGSTLSSALSSATSSPSKLYVVNVAAFSMTFRLILSSSRAYTRLAQTIARWGIHSYLFWCEHDEMRNRRKIPFLSRAVSWWGISIRIAIKYGNEHVLC